MTKMQQVDKDIGARIRARRLELGMSQTDLGTACDLTFQQIQKYEKGTNRVSGSRMAQIAGVLKVEPAFFFGTNGKAATVKENEILAMVQRPDTVRMIKAMDRIKDPRFRASLIRMVENAAEIL